MDQKKKATLVTNVLKIILLISSISLLPMVVLSESLTTNDKIYSKDQAKTGEELYRTNCLTCHDKKYFRPVFKTWTGQSLGTFFLVMNASMPQGNPGSLHIEEYTDILAYMLSLSRYSAGESKLSSSTEFLNSITIEDRKK
tara:strand:+ start:20915 stop:21337 length:423 start_codon:yes stop_codon:yes gene_type:complete